MNWLTRSFANTRQKGEFYELEAEHYLSQQGLTPVERNFWCKLGEIDLIMKDQQTWVFIEVKYRKGLQYGGANAAFTKQKQQRLHRAISVYIQQHQLQNSPLRVDFMAINGQNPYQFNWFKNVL